MTGRIIRGVAACGLLLILAGCYETDFPVIEAGKGSEVPGLAGTYKMDDDTVIVIAGKAASSGYEYILRDAAGEEIPLLIDSIGDELWIAQLEKVGDGSPSSYMFLFLGKTDGNYVFRIPNMMDEPELAENLATAHEVEFDVAESVGGEPQFKVKGSPENVYAFLRDHPGKVKLEDMIPLIPQ